MVDENVEITNAKQEIKEIVEPCNFCGICKEIDPVFRVLREEAISSRGRSILFNKGAFNKSVFNSTLDGSCKHICPFGIDIDAAIRKARKIMNLKGHEDPANKKILEKIKNKQNPFID